MGQVVPFHLPPVLARALVWSLIGLIFSPLYLVLTELLRPTLGVSSPVAGAAIAGGIGAAFYGARQLALMASLIGTGSAAVTMGISDGGVAVWQMSLAAVVISLAVGFLIRFPYRCSAEVGVKVLAGLIAGSSAAFLMLMLTELVGLPMSITVRAAMLVSVTGVLYVALLVWRPERAGGRGRYCDLTEGLVIAVIAVVAANGLIAFAGVFSGDDPVGLTLVLLRTVAVMPQVVLYSMLAGAIAGGLLELFEFDWVDRA
jgi:hypothetical protein